MSSEEKRKALIFDSVFHGNLRLLDHWYHLFVAIYYHRSGKLQDGILYKMTGMVLLKTENLWNMNNFSLTGRGELWYNEHVGVAFVTPSFL